VDLMLDDFGSGQSSFTSVLALPVDSARVDTASSQGLDGRPELLKVLNALAALGHALDLSVSAQGISTLGQLTALRGLDFDAVQGDFVAPVRNTVGIARLLAMEARLAERSSALAAEFAGRVSVETVDRLLFESLPQLAAAITNSDSDLVEGFVRRRLEALVGGPRGAVAGSKLVLFVCVHNAGRSQMAAAITAARGRGRVRAESAGSRPADQINPSVRQAMVEIGIQLDTCFPKPLSLELVHAADIIVTMGCGDACPVFPGKRYLDWKLADPAGGTVETARLIRDQVAKYVDELLADLDQTPDAD
jgi:protein-tyrosine-phosphatase